MNQAERFDAAMMQAAIRIGARHTGATWPNPSVGAVVVKEGQILAAACTGVSGRPHAEPQALALAGDFAKGATLYITLEPCAHTGKTPPCTQSIIQAGIARVVMGCADPDIRVAGLGVAQLRAAGIEVVESVCKAEAQAHHAAYLKTRLTGLPWVAVKLATSLDGAMATASGESQWITGKKARQYGHALRARHDAILTGIGTVLVDNPRMDCRLPGHEHFSPQRIVCDRQGRMPEHAAMLQTGNPPWIERETDDLEQMLRKIAERGITSVLVEAGPTLTTAFLKSSLVDCIYWFQAPLIIGKGQPAVNQPLAETLAEMVRYEKLEERALGADKLMVLKPHF